MRKKLLNIWAICVLLVAGLVIGIAIFNGREQPAPPPVQSVPASISTAPFANISESAIPGRYKIYGNEEYFVTLYADHTFLNKDGTIHPKHGWYLTPEALVLKWIANETRFDQIEAPGVYSGPKSIGGRRRMVKQPAQPSDLRKPTEFPEVAPVPTPRAP
jgi:hypothetical protein